MESDFCTHENCSFVSDEYGNSAFFCSDCGEVFPDEEIVSPYEELTF